MPNKLLGCKVRDRVSGFTGIVTTTSEHLTGCSRCWVEGPCNDKGETQERWIDEARLEILQAGAVALDPRSVASAPSPSNCGHPRG